MTDAETYSTELTAYVWKRRDSVVYRSRLSALYHLKRERFFDTVDKFASAVTAVAATAAVGTVLKGNTTWELGLSVAVAVLSLVPLVFNPAQKARHHGQLAAEFRRLLSDCERGGERWSEEFCSAMLARALEIEAAEPAPLAALVADCQNQLALSRGSKPVAKLRFYERWLKHWVDFRPDAAAG